MKFSEPCQRVLTHNINEAMLACLAEELGVRADALRRLGVGYLPVAVFATGINYDGHWTFPERDAAGRVVGISLRNRLNGSRKPMLPGSKHGLFFAPGRVDADTSDRWVRVGDAGVLCPVCGKPDWCLVDAADPHNPAVAICPRFPSAHDLGESGWLHILDSKRASVSDESNTQILPASDFPVVVVEGGSDTAAVMSLGVVAVGRPSARGGLEYLATLCRGRDVVIIGENDQKKDGSWPGKFGAEKAATALDGIAKTVRIVFPPADRKDVRTWIVTDRLSREALEEYIEKYAGAIHPMDEPDTLPDDEIETVAQAYEAVHHTDGESTIRYCKGEWFDYGSDGWVRVENREGRRHSITRFMRDRRALQAGVRPGDTVKVVGLNPSASRIKSVLGLVESLAAEDREPAVWTDGRTAPDPKQILLFTNGRLSVDAYLRGDDTLEPHTASLFSTARLPYAYDASATCPRWEQWLEETLGDDENKIALLQEWFGYNMIPDGQYEKMLLMHGRAGTGKSTALSVLESLLGVNATSSSLRNFSTLFGLVNLLGKLACIMPDARLPEHGGTSVVQALLEIVGNDSVIINRKFKDSITAKLPCRITLATNNIPNLPSESDALKRRIMFLRFNTSFTANPDTTLKDRLKDEMAGVMQWALAGLARLSRNGQFTVTATQADDEQVFRNLTDPVSEYAETWLVYKKGAKVEVKAVWAAWRAYCEERGISVGTQERLFQRLRNMFHDLRRHTTEDDGQTRKWFLDIDMRAFTINAERHRRTG